MVPAGVILAVMLFLLGCRLTATHPWSDPVRGVPEGEADADADADGDTDADGDADTDADTDTDTGGPPPPTFFDDFDGASLDAKRWKVLKRNWGGTEGGEDYNGGVVPELVSVSGGVLVLEAHGDLHDGLPLGIHKDLTPRDDGTRVGAAIATEDYFGSGRYEARIKLAPDFGVSSAMWSFHYQEWYPGEKGYEGSGPYYIVNHEVDIEFPGRPSFAVEDMAFDWMLNTTWTGTRNGEFTTSFTQLEKPLNDGEFHVFRYDWHTGGKTEVARVEFFVDGELYASNSDDVPTHKSRFYLGAWFPKNWAGEPDFAISRMEVDWVSFDAFDEPGDVTAPETYPDYGWAD
jgi:beta-glucanase (GH16 family)